MQTSNGKGQIGLMSERPLFANVLLKPFKFGKLSSLETRSYSVLRTRLRSITYRRMVSLYLVMLQMSFNIRERGTLYC